MTRDAPARNINRHRYLVIARDGATLHGITSTDDLDEALMTIVDDDADFGRDGYEAIYDAGEKPPCNLPSLIIGHLLDEYLEDYRAYIDAERQYERGLVNYGRP